MFTAELLIWDVSHIHTIQQWLTQCPWRVSVCICGIYLLKVCWKNSLRAQKCSYNRSGGKRLRRRNSNQSHLKHLENLYTITLESSNTEVYTTPASQLLLLLYINNPTIPKILLRSHYFIPHLQIPSKNLNEWLKCQESQTTISIILLRCSYLQGFF